MEYRGTSGQDRAIGVAAVIGLAVVAYFFWEYSSIISFLWQLGWLFAAMIVIALYIGSYTLSIEQGSVVERQLFRKTRQVPIGEIKRITIGEYATSRWWFGREQYMNWVRAPVLINDRYEWFPRKPSPEAIVADIRKWRQELSYDKNTITTWTITGVKVRQETAETAQAAK